MPPVEEQYDPDDILSFSPWLFYHIFRSVLIEYQHIWPKIDSTIGGILFRRLAKDYRIKDAFPSPKYW